MDLADRLATALEKRNLHLQISLVHSKDGLLSALDDAAARRHSLAIVIPPEDGIVVPAALSRHMPIVSLISPCRNIPFLSPDEEMTGSDGVDYLYKLGHRKIAFLSSRRRAYAITARAAGYRKRMAELGLRPRVLYSADPSSWKKSPPTAIFCHNDWIAIQAIWRMNQSGVAVPGNVSVLGIDHSPTLAALFPDLTTLAYPMDAAISALLARLDGKERSLASTRFAIVKRGTVAAPLIINE